MGMAIYTPKCQRLASRLRLMALTLLCKGGVGKPQVVEVTHLSQPRRNFYREWLKAYDSSLSTLEERKEQERVFFIIPTEVMLWTTIAELS